MKIKVKSEHGPFHASITVIASVIALGGIVLSIWAFIFHTTHEETNDAQVEQYVTPIVTRITGYVKEIRYLENQYVHKGDTLVILDDREYKTQFAAALADIESAKQNVILAEKNAIAVSRSMAVEQSQLEAAETQVWKTGLEYQRYTALLKEEAATEQQVEQMKANYQAARAKVKEIRSNMHTTSAVISESRARIPQANTVIQMKQAASDNARLFLSYSCILAPYDGWIGKKTIQPGQVVKEGQVLASVVSKEKWVTANFKETQVSEIIANQTVTFKADATGERKYHGTVESFSPASGGRFSLLPADNATGNFIKIEQRIPIRIKLIDPEVYTQVLKAGMNVTVIAGHKR
ncbi:HlyD family secretion protein [Pedobacter suwonensis]|uniref:HlyD family secretion protein n=1 Tax=Pedobacter suwonensis TaxID=332999 RepID=UPI0036AE3799